MRSSDGTDEFDLRSFEARLGDLLVDDHVDRSTVATALLDEYASWHRLHDRLISIIAALIDDAVERGEQLGPLLERTRIRTSVGVDELVSASPSPSTVAALLRSHHSVGVAEAGPETVIFTHQCGSGLSHWRRTPDSPLVGAGEVEGVPAGVPRYCARCITTINAAGGGGWRVRPPSSPAGEPCTWEVDTRTST